MSRTRQPSAQADVHDAKDAPVEANPKPVAQANIGATEPKGTASGNSFVIKDMISGKIHLPHAKENPEDALKRISEKEKREHPAEAQFDFAIVKAGE